MHSNNTAAQENEQNLMQMGTFDRSHINDILLVFHSN